jgi:hypothetical protein
MKNFSFFIVLLFTTATASAQIPDVEWKRRYGGSNHDWGYDIQSTSEGGSIIAGITYSNDGDVSSNHGQTDIWIVKLSAAGDIEWQRTYGGSEHEAMPSVLQTSDSGYIVAGSSMSSDGDVSLNHGGFDYWVMKLDVSGNMVWQRSYGGSKSDMAYSIASCGKEGYMIAGASYSSDGDVTGHHGSAKPNDPRSDYWVIKIDKSGNLLWQRSLGSHEDDIPCGIIRTQDGNYIVAGEGGVANGDITENLGFSDCWLVKISGSGDVIWQRSAGTDHGDKPNSIYETVDGHLLLTGIKTGYEYDWDNDAWGETTRDCFVTKLTTNGDSVWYETAGGPAYDKGTSVVERGKGADSKYIVFGIINSKNCDVSPGALTNFASHVWMLQYTASGNLEESKCLADSVTVGVGNMVKTSDGGLLLAGSSVVINTVGTFNVATNDLMLVKLKGTSIINDTSKVELPISAGPNPTPGPLLLNSKEALTIRVYDVLGRMVREVKDTKSVSLADLPTAVYFVRAFDIKGRLVLQQKVLKQ